VPGTGASCHPSGTNAFHTRDTFAGTVRSSVLPFPLTVPQRRLVAAAALCLVAAVFFLHQRHSATAGAPPLRAGPIAPAAPARPKSIVVDVAGAVERPGLYHLASGSRVADAVERAGGLTRTAERTAVNLAAPVSDGQQVLVPSRGAAAASSAAPGAAGPISLSSATAEQLDTLPGVGPVTAQKIVEYRSQHGPFTSVEALDAIPGIGPARIADLKGLVVP
jgi:competence protein ComEA